MASPTRIPARRCQHLKLSTWVHPKTGKIVGCVHCGKQWGHRYGGPVIRPGKRRKPRA